MVADQIPGKRARGAVVEQNKHYWWGVGASALCATNARTALTCSRVTPNSSSSSSTFMEVLEHRRDWRPGSFEYPCATALAWDALHGRALGPIKSCCHVRKHLSLQYLQRISDGITRLRRKPNPSGVTYAAQWVPAFARTTANLRRASDQQQGAPPKDNAGADLHPLRRCHARNIYAALKPAIALASRYSSRPNLPHSRPLPDCL